MESKENWFKVTVKELKLKEKMIEAQVKEPELKGKQYEALKNNIDEENKSGKYSYLSGLLKKISFQLFLLMMFIIL